MNRSSTTFAVLAGLFLTAGVTLADQLQLLSRADAQKASRALPVGTLFVDWISHMPDSQPQLKRVLKVEVKPYGNPADGYFEVVLKTKLLGTATRQANAFETPWDWNLAVEQVEKTESVDLAYVYIPSREIDNTFVVLGKKLKLPCEVDSIALEVPGRVLNELATRVDPIRGVISAIPGR
jgi:hypothetical protein